MSTVLIVDDAHLNRKHIAGLLAEHGVCDQTVFAEDGLHAFKVLRSMPIDLVVCDLSMPRCDGFTFLRLKGSEPAFASIPVIVVAGAEDANNKVRALTSGASDYVVKPFHERELLARISVHMKLRELQTQLMTVNGELTKLTLTDPLTAVGNRRAMLNALDEEHARAQRYSRPMSFALIDIDHFKRVNDGCGHRAGDAVLTEVASLIKHCLRKQDVVARFGGEEFAVIMPETSMEQAMPALDRLRSTIARHDVSFEGNLIGVTVSIGIADLEHKAVSKPEDLVSLADAALYEAKRSGRNRVITAK